jgi:hypothetical protein
MFFPFLDVRGVESSGDDELCGVPVYAIKNLSRGPDRSLRGQNYHLARNRLTVSAALLVRGVALVGDKKNSRISEDAPFGLPEGLPLRPLTNRVRASRAAFASCFDCFAIRPALSVRVIANPA